MAVFNKINEKRGLIVGSIVVALLLFIVGGELLNPSSIFNFKSKVVAKIDGYGVSEKEYAALRERTDQESQILYQRSADENQLSQQVWGLLVYKHAYEPQFEKLGLTVTEQESDALKLEGKFMHSHIKGFFSQNGQFNSELYHGFLANFDKLPQEAKVQWLVWESKLTETRLREKYVNLMKKTEYVTKAEAKRSYVATTEKATVKYLYVPYYTVADSTVKITDEMLNEYLAAHLYEYKVEDGRNIDFVVFDVKPSSKDSSAIFTAMNTVKTEFINAKNDTLFVKENSSNAAAPAWLTARTMPAGLTFQQNLVAGTVYGPTANPQTNAVELYKLIQVKDDTSNATYVKASHILVQVEKTAPQEKREQARAKAEALLVRAKAGEDFGKLAADNSDDTYSARENGNLPLFGKGEMVPPFEAACFSAKRTGVVPTLVETDFGYHIINVLALPQKGKQYLVATVSQEIYASDDTKDQAQRSADEFREKNNDTAKFYEAVRKDKLNKQSHQQLRKNDRNITGVENAREVVTWAFREADVEDISPVFSIDNGSKFVVAVLTGKTDEGYAELKDKKDEVRMKVLNQEKGKIIKEKLEKFGAKSFEELVTMYGAGAQTSTDSTLSLQGSYVAGIGYDPVLLGRVFGMKPGAKTGVLAGESCVVIIEVVSITKAPDISDYSSYKAQVRQSRESRDEGAVDQAINKLADIKDNRYMFY